MGCQSTMISLSARMALDLPFVVFSVSGLRSDPQSLAAYMRTLLLKRQSPLVFLTFLKITPCSSGVVMGRSGTRLFSLHAVGANCCHTIAFSRGRKETTWIIPGGDLTDQWKNCLRRILNSTRKSAGIWPLERISSHGAYGCSEFSPTHKLAMNLQTLFSTATRIRILQETWSAC
jgi:hypothetical protein